MVGDIVHYTFDETQAHWVSLRNPGGARGQVPGVLPKAGDKLPAVVLFEYGGNVVDLRVQLRGTANHFIQNVPQGTAGQQGRWAARS
ncbi:hypothetical protein ACX27O_24970 [Micromonospora sp. SD19]